MFCSECRIKNERFLVKWPVLIQTENKIALIKSIKFNLTSTLTIIKLRLDNQEVRKTTLAQAQYNRPNKTILS